MTRFWADRKLLGEPRDAHLQRFVEFAGSRQRGRVQYRWDRDRDHLLSLAVRLYANQNIFVVAKNSRETRHVADVLHAAGLSNVLTDDALLWKTQPRIYVAPIAKFQLVNPDDWQIVLFADIDAALARSSLWMASQLPQQVQHVFLPHDRKLDKDQRFWLDAIFGEETFHALPPADRPDTVHVILAECPSTRTASNQTALERKRISIWHSKWRNKFITEIALALAARDHHRIQRYGGHGQEHDVVFGELTDTPRIAILVEVPEHARILGQLLPGWQIRISTGGTNNNIMANRSRSIVTFSWAERHGLRTDVVIRADATCSPWATAWGPHIRDVRERLLIIDVTDNFDKQAKRDTKRRTDDYVQRGWQIVGSQRDELARAEPVAID